MTDRSDVSVERPSTTGVQSNSQDLLSNVLERDHRAIDAGIEAFTAVGPTSQSGGKGRAALVAAIGELRLHIFLEEEHVFPPLGEAGLVGPIMVMVREHGQMWRTLDWLNTLLAQGAPEADLEQVCRELMSQLQRHNTKEETILYPQADDIVSAEAASRIRAELVAGAVPDCWVCQGR